jgi:hypothetical protein
VIRVERRNGFGEWIVSQGLGEMNEVQGHPLGRPLGIGVVLTCLDIRRTRSGVSHPIGVGIRGNGTSASQSTLRGSGRPSLAQIVTHAANFATPLQHRDHRSFWRLTRGGDVGNRTRVEGFADRELSACFPWYVSNSLLLGPRLGRGTIVESLEFLPDRFELGWEQVPVPIHRHRDR